jgi:hypothetical protein
MGISGQGSEAVKYRVFRFEEAWQLEDQVTYWLEHGGQLVGGLNVIQTSTTWFAQAMLIPIGPPKQDE